jgi:hypothetical protein
MNPPKVQEKREQQSTLHIAEIEKKAREFTETHKFGPFWKRIKRSNSWTNRR